MAVEKVLKANIAPFGLRMQPELKARIEEAARANERSMNAEIIARLEATFEGGAAALIEATAVAESLRDNLTARMDTYDRLFATLQRRELAVAEAELDLAERQSELDRSLEEQLRERRDELEQTYARMIKSVEAIRDKAANYADFTVARERQFYEAVKKMTGVEPPPVDEEAARIRQARLTIKDTSGL